MRASHQHTKRGVVKTIALGAALSALAGYVAGLLTAPRSGKETRQVIKNKATETYEAAEKELKRLHTELADVIGEVNDRFSTFRNPKEVDEALKKGRNAKQKAREVLSVLHDGEAVDEDLKAAIKDATKAIERLRDFLHKS